MGKPSVYTEGRQLSDEEMYIFSLFDLEPAGILVSGGLFLMHFFFGPQND